MSLMSLLILNSLTAVVAVSVLAASATRKHSCAYNTGSPRSHTHLSVLAPLTRTVLAPLTGYGARRAAMRAAEERRERAIAASLSRHPAGRALATRRTPATVEDFDARARAIHVSDQVMASIQAAMAAHPASLGARARAMAAHPASIGVRTTIAAAESAQTFERATVG